MDAGFMSSSSRNPVRPPLRDQFHRRRAPKENLDRFIPNRAAMDFDYAHYMLTERRKRKEDLTMYSPSREAYQKKLAEAFNMNRTQILAFKSKPDTPFELIPKELFNPAAQSKPAKSPRHIPQSSERTLDAPDHVDDYYLNLLDWGSGNILAIALGNTVYLWDASDGCTAELCTVLISCIPIGGNPERQPPSSGGFTGMERPQSSQLVGWILRSSTMTLGYGPISWVLTEDPAKRSVA